MADGRCSGVTQGNNDLVLLQCANDSTFATLLDLGLANELPDAGRDWHLVSSENVDMTSRITDICHEKVNWWNWSDFQALTRNGFKKFMSEDKPSWQGERQRIYNWLTNVKVNMWGNCSGIDHLRAFREMLQAARSCDNANVKAWLAAVIDALKKIPATSPDMGWSVVEAFAAKGLEQKKMEVAMRALSAKMTDADKEFPFVILFGHNLLNKVALTRDWLGYSKLTPAQKTIYEKFKEMYETQGRERAETARPKKAATRPRMGEPRREEPETPTEPELRPRRTM